MIFQLLNLIFQQQLIASIPVLQIAMVTLSLVISLMQKITQH
jgi:flagellar biosynthesis protein FliQ